MKKTDPGKSKDKTNESAGEEKEKDKPAKNTVGKETRSFRIAVRINEILNVKAEGKSEAYEQLKKMTLGDLINRDSISFLGK